MWDGGRRRRLAWGLRLGLGTALLGAIALSGATGATSASAAATRLQHARVLPYPMAQVWPTALRYLRVDRGYAVVDRDAEAGYVLFDFPVGDGSSSAGDGEEVRVGRGSLELLATVDASGRPSVKLQVSTDAGPTHLPHAIAEGLATKLKNERGQPAPPPPRAPAPKKPPGESPPDQPDDPDDGSLPTLPPAVDPSDL